MNNGIIAILDSDAEYALKLSEYFNLKSGLNYSVSVFTDYDSLKKFLCENKIDILLISEHYCQYISELTEMTSIFVLTENRTSDTFETHPRLCKYQSTDHILRDVMSYYASSADEHFTHSDTVAYITGIYSPVKRCGKTSFALAYGCILSLTHSCLYINFEEYSGFSFFIPDLPTGDLSDLLYFYRQNPANIAEKLAALSHTYHNLTYIPPMHFSYDIKNMEATDLISFIRAISKAGMFEYLLLDLSDSLKDVPALLAICDKIYMPVTTESISRQKTNEFFKSTSSLYHSNIKDKTEILTLPYADHSLFSTDYSGNLSGNFMENLLIHDFGIYIQNLISHTDK